MPSKLHRPSDTFISWANKHLPVSDGCEWYVVEGEFVIRSLAWGKWCCVYVYPAENFKRPTQVPEEYTGKRVIASQVKGELEMYWGEAPDDPYETMKVMYGIFCMLDK